MHEKEEQRVATVSTAPPDCISIALEIESFSSPHTRLGQRPRTQTMLEAGLKKLITLYDCHHYHEQQHVVRKNTAAINI